MTRSPSFDVEPWGIGVEGVNEGRLNHRESVFALSNGHIGVRGTLDEGEPHGTPGTYLNRFYEERPMHYIEGGYGYPDSDQVVVPATDGTVIRLLVDDEPLDVRRGTLRHHRQRLDFRRGVLERELEWVSPAGAAVRVRSERLVSFAERAVLAIRYEVEAVGSAVRIGIQSDLHAEGEQSGDRDHPRDTDHPLLPLEHHAHGATARLAHRTENSGITLVAAMDHVTDAAATTEATSRHARTTLRTHLAAGERFSFVKLVAYAWSRDDTTASLVDDAEAALADARESGWHGLVAAQRQVLDEYWRCVDVEVDGDERVQQAVRFALFHVLSSSLRTEGGPLPAKALTGDGYEGHAFWETECHVLPVLSYTFPESAADLLQWRHETLPLALDRARTLRLAGAAFPWRTIDGGECSGYWPAGSAAFHVNAAIADALLRHVRATGDTDLERRIGVDLLVQTARLWISLGRTDDAGAFHIDGITGPDEYSAIVDDNVYTNLMAQRNLHGAADVAERHPREAAALGVDGAEIARWRAAADGMTVLYDETLGVHPQDARFLQHARWDFENTAPDEYPLHYTHPYLHLYRSQVVKQADLVLALHVRSDAFTPEQKARDFAYYEQVTVRDSSLSAATQAILAAEVGHLELAHDYVLETALMDIEDLHDDVDDGLHIAALGGLWRSLVAGFGGMRHSLDGLRFAPRLPPRIGRLAFGLKLGGGLLRVEVRPDAASYRWSGPGVCELYHHGERVEVTDAVELPIPDAPDPGPAPTQPRGREPRTITGR